MVGNNDPWVSRMRRKGRRWNAAEAQCAKKKKNDSPCGNTTKPHSF